ncbi:MAG: DNA mismatch repair protein MutL, partial [Limisphaerales bacterium]
ANILMEILDDIRALGFDVQPFGDNAFVVHGLPPDCGDIDGKTAIDEFLEAYRGLGDLVELEARVKVARSAARSNSVKHGMRLSLAEMKGLIDDLFACRSPYAAPGGQPTILTFSNEELKARFSKP